MEKVDKIYDVIVIGAGPGGMTAALYASRSNLDTLLIEKGIPGGQMNNTATVENYTGFGAIEGPDLAAQMYEGSMQFGADYVFGDVKAIEKADETIKEVHTKDKIFKTHAVVISTGSEHRKLQVEGEEEFNGRGVSYCAVCDGAFFKNRDIVVVGGGDSAVEEGVYLTQFADKVTIIHRRDELRAQQILQDRAFENDKVEFLWDSEVEKIDGGDSVSTLTVRNTKTSESSEFDAEGVFIYIGLLPNTEAFADLGITDEEGWIVTDEQMRTKIPGIYAVGDVRQTPLRQIATAVGDGAQAGHDVYNYIESLDK